MYRALIFLLTTACAAPAVPPSTAASTEDPMPVDELIPAVDVSPAEALLTWFQGEGSGVYVRVPVVVVPSPLGLSSGYVAASTATPEDEALHLILDDGALGISLADRLRPDCPYDVPCVIWVEGTFGATAAGLSPPTSSVSQPTLTFSVRTYIGRVKEPAPWVLRKVE